MLEINKRTETGVSALTRRPRRLRRSGALRRMVRETAVSPDDFILPMFVTEGERFVRPIASMPGQAQRSVDMLAPEVDEAVALRIPALLLFGIPAEKDATGTGAWDEQGPVQRAIRTIKRQVPEMVLIADLCLCE